MVWVAFIGPFHVGEQTSGMDCKSVARKAHSGIQRRRPSKARVAWAKKKRTGQECPVRDNPRLELELQRELDQARLSVADCTGYMSEVGVVRCAAAGIWRSELRVVKEVEKLSAEFDVAPFADGSLLENCPVEVGDALLSQSCIHARLAAEAPGRRLDETARVEPTAQFGRGTSGH